VRRLVERFQSRHVQVFGHNQAAEVFEEASGVRGPHDQRAGAGRQIDSDDLGSVHEKRCEPPRVGRIDSD
jgi:hypothetical protein